MEDVQDNKMRIMCEAGRLFTHYGMRCVSMDEISKAVGCSKKTLYQYYEDKDELVASVIRSFLEDNMRVCADCRAKAENVIHEAFLELDIFQEFFKMVSPSIITELKKYHPRAYDEYQKYKNEHMYKLVADNITRGVQQGLYREDLNVDVISRFRVETALTTFLPGFYEKINTPFSLANRELFYYFLYGLATIKGHKLISKYQKNINK